MQTKPIAKNQTNFLQVIGEHKCCVHCKSNVHAPHTTGCPVIEKWEEELDEQFWPCEPKKNGDIKDFIRSLLSQREDEILREAEEYLKKNIRMDDEEAKKHFAMTILRDIIKGKREMK